MTNPDEPGPPAKVNKVDIGKDDPEFGSANATSSSHVNSDAQSSACILDRPMPLKNLALSTLVSDGPTQPNIVFKKTLLETLLDLLVLSGIKKLIGLSTVKRMIRCFVFLAGILQVHLETARTRLSSLAVMIGKI